MTSRTSNFDLGNFNLESLLMRYVALTICANAFFISSIWIFFWLARVNYATLGYLELAAFAVGWFAEIPSGVLADRYGRARIIAVGLFASACGIGLQGLADSAAPLGIGEALYLIGFAFFSGAGEAWLYDVIPDSQDKESIYQHVLGRAARAALWADIVALSIGVAVYQYSSRAPFLLSAVALLVGAVIASTLPEPRRTRSDSAGPRIRELIAATWNALTPALGAIIVFSISVSGIYYAYSWGYIRPAIVEQAGVPPPAYSALQIVGGIAIGLVVRHLYRFRSWLGDYGGLALLTILFAGCFLWLGFSNTVLVACITIPVSTLAGNLIGPWTTLMVNQRTSSEVRASVLSTVAAGTKLPYCLFAVMGGMLLAEGRASTLYLFLAEVVFFGGIGALLLLARCESKRAQ